MNIIKLLKHCLFICITFHCFNFVNAQSILNKEGNEIFKGRVTATSNYNKPNQRFIKDFSVGIKWSVYLGEPVESYAFKWNASNSFIVKINGQDKTFTRSQINEYPDLASQLNKVKPVSLEVIVYGKASGNSISVKRGGIPKDSEFYVNNLPTYKKNGQSYDRYSLLTDVLYKIGDQHFLFGSSGQERNGSIVGTSPEWNNFISWKQKTSNVSTPNAKFDYLVRNYSKSKFKSLSEDDKNEVNNKFKRAYLNTNKFSLNTEIVKIDWGYQLINIANTYLKYKKEGKNPKKKKDDFWSGDDDKIVEKTNESDDFWSGKSNNSVKSDFWSGKGSTEEEVEVQKNIATATGNQYIGQKEVMTRKIIISYYDHGKIDGDRINITQNGKTKANNITLKSYKETLSLELEDGVNRISFEALNQGSAGQNTASFTIYDANKNILYTNQWNINTGFKGTLLLIKL